MDSHEGIPIFLVMGATGEYEDYKEWAVCAYRNVEAAQEHAKKAEEEAKKISASAKTSSVRHHPSSLDANMQIDYTGTTYYVEETVLHQIFRNF